MATIADSAVGAILEIPPATLNQIKNAEKAIESLQKTSNIAATTISNHWGVTAVDGLNKFIQALKNAQGEISNFKTNDININIKPAEQKLNDVSNSAKKTADDVSNAVVRLAQSDINFTNFVELDKVVSKLGLTYQSLAKDVKDFETQRKGMQVNDPETQEINKKIEALKEYLRVKKQSETRQQYSTTTVDRDILSEQKRLLQDQINLQKQLNEQKIKVKSGGITENANLEKEKKDLEDLRNKYIENGKALKTLAQEKKNLSDAGSRQFELNAEKQTNQLLEQQRRYRQDLNKELNKTRELTSATQVSKATISSRDESQIQRQLNNDYSAMIRIIREVGKVKADAAKEGRATNQQEDALIKTLWERYRGFAKEVLSIQNSYAALGRARAEAFRNDRSEQLARNAVLLSQSIEKATQAAEKQARALHDISPVIQAYNQINSQIERETNLLQQVKDKAAQASQEFQNWKNINPTFDFSKTQARLDELKVKIDEIKAKAASQGPTKASITMAAAKPLQAEYDALSKTMSQFLILMDRESTAMDNVGLAIQKYTPRLEAMRGESNRLSQEIERLVSANAKFNSELSKGNNVKSLSTEYKNLVTTIQRLGEQMNAFRTAGGDTSSTSYRAMMSELQKLVAREKEIRMMSINEVEAYRQERAKAAYQADLSAFIQTEAQKTAAAKQAAQEESDARKRAMQSFLQTYQGAMLQADKVMSGRGGTSMFATNLENIKRAINDLKAASGKLNLLDPKEAQKAEQLKRKIAELETLLKKYKAAATPDKPVISPQDAINAAKSATSLKQLQDAYKNLKAVMSTTDPKSDIWKQMNTVLGQTKTQIDNIRTKMGELQSQSKRTGDVVSQLKGQLGAVFSIAAITGYIKKMVDVRAQFELQNVALRAILQNKDEADRIFMQVQQMALQSPFTIMQLTTYTKQLAAYRIEADKLVGTTKMLANVSAGLGVSMDRLILAYGQVKSANYLRATEVRQFTEAGLNIAGELANYFSELQGKMISVGDVMEMITKRMVRFEDVEEVFKRVTSAGGLFYDMQKKQAETLSGQLQRIQDAYSIMLNDIGKSNQGNISTVLTWIRQLILSWREVLAAAKSAATGFAAYLLVLKIFKLTGAGVFKELVVGAKLLIADMKTATFWTNALKTAWRGVMSATGIGIIVAALTTWLSYLWETREAVAALNEELGRIGSESLDEMNNSIGKFIELAKVVSDTSKTYTEHQAAIDELKRSYGEILPEQKLQSDYIKALNGDYRDLTDTIAQYYQAQEYQKKVEAIMSGDTFKSFSDEMKEAGSRMLERGMFDPYVTKSQVDAWVEVITKEIASGKLENSTQAIGKRMQEVFGDALNGDTRRVGGYFTDAVEEANKLTGAIEELSIVTVAAKKNYQEGLGQALLGVSDKKIAETIEDVAAEIAAAQERIAKNKELLVDPNIMENPQGWANVKQAIDDDTIAIERNTEKLREHYAVLAEREGLKVAEYIEEGTNKITEQVTAYYNLNKRLHELKASGKLTAETERELSKEMNEAFNSANALANVLGFELSRNALDAMDSEYALGEETKSIAQRAFPALAQKAIEAMDDVQKALLRGELGFAKFKNAINNMTDKLGFKVFDDQTKTIEQLNQQIESLAKGTASASSNIDDAAKEAQSIRDAIAEKYGVRASDLDIKRGADENLRMYASSLRKQGDEAIKAYNDYLAAVEKGQTAVDGKINGYTKEEIELIKKKGDALLEYADQVYTEAEKEKKSGAKGKDPILKQWEDRLDALKRYYDAAEKARKNLSTYETRAQQEVSFEDLFASLGMNNLKGLSLKDLLAKGFDPELLQKDYVGALKKLLKLIPEEYKDLRNKVQEIISSESIEIQFKIKEAEREKLQKDIDELFANMELTKTFADLGLNVDLTYIVGGKPTTLADVRKQLESMSADMANKSLEEQKIYQKALETLRKKEHDNQIARIKNYNKYLLESMSERVQIELKAMQEINKIRNDETLDQFSKDQAVMNRRKQMQEDMAKQVWKEFQGTDMYINMFKDVEKASTESIQRMIAKLNEMKDSLKHLPADQVRAIVRQMEQLNDVLIARNPFKGLADGLKETIGYLRERKQIEQEIAKLEQQLSDTKGMIDEQQKVVYNLQMQYDAAKNNKNISSEEVEALREKLELAKNTLKVFQSTATVQQNSLDKLNTKQQQGQAKAAAIQQAFQQIKQYAEESVSHVNGIVEGLDKMGALSDAARDNWESFMEGFSAMNDIAEGGINTMTGYMTGNYAQMANGILQGIKGTVNFVAAIFGMGDKKKERQIKKLQERVEDLDKAYQKLEKSIEKTFTFDQYNAGYKQMQQNLAEQKNAYEEMIRLEEAKKKTDKDKVKEYKDKLDELAEAEKELHDQRIEAMGSTTDYMSEAEGFVSAWLDAYKETGDGLDALKENWDEFIENLFTKQAAAQIVSTKLKSVIDIINSAIDKGATDFELADAVNEARSKWEKYAAEMVPALEELFGSYGLGGKAGEFVLSDLQKGIQNITEPQAAAIEAYLNSMRFAVFRHTEQLDTLIASVQAQYGSGAENPIVTELKGIRTVLDSIDRRLGSVIENRVGRGGAVIRIVG